MVYATETPSPTDSLTVFGPRPLFAAGGATKVIVDDFGYIDYTLTDQERTIIQSSISDWKSQGIDYGAYYGLGGSETSALTDPEILDVARAVNLDGTLESNFSFTRQGQLDYLLASGKLAIDLGASYIFMDGASPNLSNPSFDSETLSNFNTYLGDTYTSTELSNFGISDLTSFNYGQYLRDAGYTDSDSIYNSPPTNDLFKAWLKHMRKVERTFFTQWTTQLKEYGSENYDRTIYLGANRSTGSRQWANIDLFDYGIAETFLDALGWPYRNLVPVYKTIDNFDKRFWSWNFPSNTNFESGDANALGFGMPLGADEAEKLFFAETFGAGALVQNGINWVDFHRNDKRIDSLRSFLQFPSRNSSLFNLDNYGQFAILLSEIGEVEDVGSTNPSFNGASYLLADMQWTYDVVFAAYPDRRDGSDLLTLAKLQKYDAVVLPNSRYLSDSQVEILTEYVNAGGTLIGFGRIADQDDSGVPRGSTRTFDDYFEKDLITEVGSGKIIAFSTDLGKSYYDNAANESTKTSLRETFTNSVDGQLSPDFSLTYTGSGSGPGESPDVFVNRFKSDDGSWIIHLVNRNMETDESGSSEKKISDLESTEITMLLPTGYDTSSVVVSFIDADASEVKTLSHQASGSNIVFNLPDFSIWSVLKIGSTMNSSTSINDLPHSTPGTEGQTRSDDRDEDGEIRYVYWYWKGGNHGTVPFDVPYVATDDIGLKSISLYYRFSVDRAEWTDWTLVESTDISGKVASGNFSFDAPDGEGHYEFSTKATDSSDQVEVITPWNEQAYGVDQTAPIPPESISTAGSQKNGFWTTDISDLKFSWDKSKDNLSGIVQYQVSIRGMNGSDIVLENISSGEEWTPDTSELVSGNAYKFRLRVEDNAGNWNSGHDVFDLLYGESPVSDVTSPSVAVGDSKLTISWVNPNDSNYVGARVDVRPTNEPYASWIQSGLVNKDQQGEVSVPELINGVDYEVRVIAFAADNKHGNYVTLSSRYTPGIDSDGDGVLDHEDAFPQDSSEQLDTDGDGTGNNADTDDDGDEILDDDDEFPLDATESVDTDGDGTGNNADTDDDNDNVLDEKDEYPLISLGDRADADGDGIPNDCDADCQTAGMAADTDDDNDGVLDGDDALPLDATESVDTDGDGTGNNADLDDDNDGVLDGDDAFPLNASETTDTDGDGIGNNSDNCSLNANSNQTDTDGDGSGNVCDTDDDGDGVLDGDDPYPLNAPPTLTFTYGDNSTKPIAGLTLTLTESDSTVTTLTSDANGQISLPLDPTSTNTYTLNASVSETDTDPISVQDALYILQHIVELRTLDALQIKAADINTDDSITIQDALKVLQHNVELISIENPITFLDKDTNEPLEETTFSPTDTPNIAVYRLGDVNLSFDPS